jgi:VWFA-related protein
MPRPAPLLAVWLIALGATMAAGGGALPLQEAQVPAQPPFREHVEVARVLVDARVLDSRGEPIRGLGPDDFKVRLDGRVARVESAVWVEGGRVDEEGRPLPMATPREDAASTGAAMPSAGRLIVFLFQKDLHPSRIGGLMRMLIEARGFLDTFTPDDRIAIVSFDSHLKIWLDFTNDLARLDAVLHRGILFERPGPLEAAASGPSLLASFSRATAGRTYTMERALLHLASALGPLPGAKTLVIVGHGFGRYTHRVGVAFDREYGAARRAFQAARVTVVTLDTTEADYHSLEVGLIDVAEATGGFFARTHVFSGQLDRLAGLLAGHYVLFVDAPAATRGYRRLEVGLTRRSGTVLAKSGVVG